jgi:hypothetical protein
MRRRRSWCVVGVVLFVAACGGGETSTATNPFLEDQSNIGKGDTGYVNPDGIEIEVDFESTVTAPGNRITHAPADTGQYAMTWLRKTGQMYLESWAEIATSEQHVEWLVDGKWLTAAQVKAQAIATSKLTRFRLRGLNAVLLKQHVEGVVEGTVIKAKVPVKPYSTFTDLGPACADIDPHYPLDQTYYWDAWNPDKKGCPATAVNLATITVRKLLPPARETYPEYDLLVADGKVTVVMLFGQMDDGATVSSRDQGMGTYRTMATWLKDGGFKEIKPAPLGRRFSKTVVGVVWEIDLYPPTVFAGLEDEAHFANFQKALSEHEIVTYDGHSVLGASDFWSKPSYPSFYQIYLYGGCLGYEYYLRPILDGKGGWEKLDIMSSVVEVSATSLEFAAPVIAKLMWASQHSWKASWADILAGVRRKVGDSTFGASGVQGNCFSPTGSLCGATVTQDFTRDVLQTDLTLDVTALTGTAAITLGASSSTAASFSVGDLDIKAVRDASGPLTFKSGAGQLDVTTRASAANTHITIDYGFTRHTSMKGYNQKGLTMLWPTLCGYLYPCKPNPDDGSKYTLTLTGVPSDRVAIYPEVIPAAAPSYMLAFAIGDYQKLDLGATTAGTKVSVWYYTGEKAPAVSGTAHLVAAFDWYEKTYGPYPFGTEVGSVSADWGGGAYGGMEHHPFWHVDRGTMNDEETHLHEAGHGWFGDGVRIRCWEDFVLSEGTTSYIAARALEATAGAAAGNALWASYKDRLNAAVAAGNTLAWPTTCNAIDILTDPLWSDIPYMKGAFFLLAVEKEIGRPALDRALKVFFQKHVGLAVGVADLLDTIQAEAGYDATRLANSWLRALTVPSI